MLDQQVWPEAGQNIPGAVESRDLHPFNIDFHEIDPWKSHRVQAQQLNRTHGLRAIVDRLTDVFRSLVLHQFQAAEAAGAIIIRNWNHQ